MEVHPICLGIPIPQVKSSSNRLLAHRTVSPAHVVSKGHILPRLKYKTGGSLLWRLQRGAIVCASSSDTEAKLDISKRDNSGVAFVSYNGVEPFRGKSGSVSFCGLTHQLVEEGKLMSAPFQEDKGSFLWILAPVALILSLILPQFLIGDTIENFLENEILIEFVASLTSESTFYIGLATFLLVTDHVQRPYLQFSPKRWGLITGLRGYLSFAFFTAGFKVVAPLFAVYVTWPVLGLPALVAVFPFLFGCAVQLAFETYLDKRRSSCWPLIPIIFELYRLYQLSKANHFIGRLMLPMKDAPRSPEWLERSGAMFGMVVTFQVLGVLCLWSLLTFLLRLFPSRAVAGHH
ncbi:uncharacterized protein LOC123203524 isoform X2 [Mangifera indica]|uniref:uncharacterized protein LOC123203524 isoform X2 n=1 Tax=Mangifera indica TaxID=29780 RepID=UPI001CFA4763|nr:uncharacterized protein LOC123203524 isoform X2 [Mangifera indica]